MVVRPFQYRGREVSRGEWLELEAIDAAVQAHAGLVSVQHGQAYQTRDMVAEVPVPAVVMMAAREADPVSETPPKRRRGRPRKVRD